MKGYSVVAALQAFAAARAATTHASAPSVEEHIFHSIVDHYNFRPTTVPSFPLRYYVDDRRRNASAADGPCFFYAGNEADIVRFIDNSGSIFEMAEEFGALVVFAEHRYYGLSNPFGNEYALGIPYNVSFLTVEQAMADFVLLNVHVREKFSVPPEAPFVAFGGSYGANLAMWLRLKNPNLWAGAVASSATPRKRVLRVTNGFARIATEAYANVSARCPDLVRAGWDELYRGAAAGESGRAAVASSLGLCRPLPDAGAAEDVHGWIGGALEGMVQYGYPYPASLDVPLPGRPYAVACRAMLDAGAGLGALRAAAGVYYNHTGQAGPCFDFDGTVTRGAAAHWRRKGQRDRLRRQDLRIRRRRGGRWRRLWTTTRSKSRRWGEGGEKNRTETDEAWSYQCCTEVYQPMPTDGITDFEVPHTPNQTEYFLDCARRWGVVPRPDWEEMTFMGVDIGAGSNIFLTNGQLDPWRAAGIQEVPKGSPTSIVVRNLEGAAHHLDLRAAHELDPPSVVAVRKEQRAAIRQWIKDWKDNHAQTDNRTAIA